MKRQPPHASLLQRAKWLKDQPFGLHGQPAGARAADAAAGLQGPLTEARAAIAEAANATAGARAGVACSNSPVAWWASKLLGGPWADPCRARLDLLWLAEPDVVQQPLRPPSERDLFFRPVSVTLYCVMCLTLQSILVHTSVAVARNSDELSAVTEPSFVTQVMETAGRSVPLAPVMSLLFLANRIYMLESSNGLGEVEWWVKLSMIFAAAGIAGQIITVAIVALTTVKGDVPFSQTGGDVQDAHLHILSYQFPGPCTRLLSMVLQSISMLAIYGGVGGVVTGMAFSGRGVDSESAAVCCTAAIVVGYFAIQISLWATNTGLLPSKMSKYETAIRQAAVRGDCIIQKAPMFALLILSTRMRQVKDGTPGGTPPPFLVACFVAAVVTLYVEVLLCPFTSGVLDEEDEEEGGDGTPSRDRLATRVMNFLQAVAAILGFIAASIIAGSIAKPWVEGEALPMSPTIHSVMGLCLVFFIVHLLITLYGLLRSYLRLTSTRAHDALLAARNSVNFCPLLCTLFLGCRMRALQITANKGMPQWWEQDFLYLCVGATVVEVICCLTVPAFYKEVGVDAEGNQTYDVQSVSGAYIVTVVRYLGLLGLYSGIAGVCFSVLTMTPDSATGIRPDTSSTLRSVARSMLWTMVVLMVACLLSSAKVVGLIVKLALESVDEILLNAELTVDTAVLSLFRGTIIIKGLVVSNPIGSSYKSDFLLRVGIVAVKLNLWRVVTSLAKDIQVRNLVLNGVELNYELGANGAPSNVGALMEFLEGESEQQPAPPPKPLVRKDTFVVRMMRSVGNLFSQGSRKSLPPPPPPEPPSGRAIALERILIKEVNARVLHPSLGPLVGVDLGKMDIENFSELSKGRRVGDIVVFVLKTVIRSAMTNADIVKKLMQQGTDQVKSCVADQVMACGKACSVGCFSGPAKEARERPPQK